jgi:hypothetical protein
MYPIVDVMIPACGMVGTVYWVAGMTVYYFSKGDPLYKGLGGGLMAAGGLSWYRFFTERAMEPLQVTGK